LISATQIIDPMLDGSVKGWPALGCRVSDVAERGLSLDDLPTPVLVVRESSLRHNIAAMADWCARNDVLLAPHAKTSMAPAILDRQLSAGAWGLTVADVRQALVAIGCGAERVIVANEVTSRHDLRWLCEHNARH
jgi:D-serine deaminase-like pyridoxal phosphate-dependent protein